MNRRGFSGIVALILLLISLILGTLAGLMGRRGDDKTDMPISTPGYVSGDTTEEMIASPVAPTDPGPHRKPQKPKVESYSIGGMGSTERVPVDLPDQDPSDDLATGEEREKPSIKLPKELEELGDKMKGHLDAFDEATRQTLKSVLDSIELDELSPDEATIRPKGDGLELRFSLPTGD
ncbi:hypothetical protein Dpep_0683 [Dethiosulfovibrio peptidovorans DSM 11002]|uniref:Uncharacterized protein n=2 Tax=Dethiosulfovibrio TaxID=47054 RepID=D2Z5G4_9BACT|nr:hypothetical protein Dpep_0683 [Dethiosulfovibrio peptidovorans DSM 11002]